MLNRVETLAGKEIELDIEPTYKVDRIKKKVEEEEGIPSAKQRLIFSGNQMAEDKTAAEYKIFGGSVKDRKLCMRSPINQPTFQHFLLIQCQL